MVRDGPVPGAARLRGPRGARRGERADFAPLFPASLEIKGRVAFDATHRFIRQVVDKSRTRAVTAAVCGPDPAADNSAFNDKAVAALASQYGKRERCGVAEPITGVLEVYSSPGASSRISS